MTKKHFIYLAQCIKADREHFDDTALDVLEGFCRTFNPAFNASRWRAYIAGTCGPNGGRVKHGTQ